MPPLPPDRSLDLLAGRVFDIPEPQFVDLVRSLEARRLRSDQRVTADAVLSRLRPRMSLARPPRRPTPQRLFCLPFEDLLYDPGTPRKAVGRIPRRAVAPIWTLFTEHTTPGALETAAATLRSAEPDDTATLLAVGAPLWAEGARVLAQREAAARQTPQGRAQLRDSLGGEHVLASLEDVVLTLRIAAPILTLRAALPPAPIETVGRQGMTALVEAIQSAAAIDRATVPYVIFVLMARLRDLGSLADLFDKLREAGVADLLKSAGEQAGEAVASQSEDRLLDVRAELADEDIPRADVARVLGREVDALERAARAVGGGRALTRRIERLKSELGRVAHEQVITGAGDAAMGIIGTLGDPMATAEEEAQAMRDAEDRIVALRLCRRFADDPQTGRQLSAELRQIAAGLDARGRDLIGRLAGNDADVSVVDLYNTVRLVELVDGPDKADKLRLDGLKAIRG